MQGVQNVFSFSPAPGQEIQGSPQTGEVLEGKAAGGENLNGFLAAFLAALTQGNLEKEPIPEELNLSAGQEGKQDGEGQEKDSVFSGLGANLKDKLFLSKPVLDLAASLEESGEGFDVFSKRLKELLESSHSLPDLGAERLRAMLSGFRSRLPERADIRAAASDISPLSPEFWELQGRGSAEPGLDASETGAADIVAGLLADMPRPDALRPSPKGTQKMESVSKDEPEKNSENEEEGLSPLAADGKTAMPVNAFPLIPEKSAETPPVKPEGAPRRVHDAPGAAARPVPPSAGDENKGDVQRENRAAERTSGFEQFFEGISSRHRVRDARPEALTLAREFPASQNETLREGLDNVVRFMRTSGGQRASLIVDPPALGRVSVELTSGVTGLEASIKVASEQIRQLIQDQIVQLRWALAQQGVELTQFSVDVQQDNGQRQQYQDAEQRRREGSQAEDVEGETIFRVDLNEGLLYWVA